MQVSMFFLLLRIYEKKQEEDLIENLESKG